MKTDFEILIDHLQNEVDYLLSAMEECIADWDFDGAKAFREPFFYTNRKLNILKSLKNPNHYQISDLKMSIPRLEKMLTEDKYGRNFRDEETRQRMRSITYNSLSRDIEKSKAKLESLESVIIEQRVDDDRIFEIFEKLERNEISELEFEIEKDRLFLLLNVSNQQVQLSFKTHNNEDVDRFLTESTIAILGEIGFDKETLKKQIPNFNKLDKTKFLEELAIIYFEVFDIFGEEINIKVTYV